MGKRLIPTLALAVALFLGVFAGTRTIWGAQAAPAPVKTAVAHILVNAQGMTLYLYTPDKHNKSACTGACATYWPPVLLPSGAGAPTTMAGLSGTFGVALRGDGTRQLTYDGAPLYTFIKDKKQGDMTGQGVAGTWWAVVVGTAQASTTASSSQGATATPTASSSYYGQGGDDRGYGGHGQGGPATPTPTPGSSYYGRGGDQ